MENKYYTPDIEDIRVGYECESTNDGKKWYHWKFEDHNFTTLSLELLNKMYRTPYLTKEQIEAEGWVLAKNFDEEQIFQKTMKGLEHFWELSFVDQNSHPQGIQIQISYWSVNQGYSNEYIKYTGKCPSINEFRTICKLLNIK